MTEKVAQDDKSGCCTAFDEHEGLSRMTTTLKNDKSGCCAAFHCVAIREEERGVLDESW